MRNILFSTLLLFIYNSYGQTTANDFVKLTGFVQVIDSQYCLMLNLSVSKNKEIQVNKVRYYDGVSSERINFLKLVRGFRIDISHDAIRDRGYDSDYDKFQKVDNSHPLSDTIILDNFIPFEIGDYLVYPELDYYIGSSKYTAEGGYIPFKVLFLPPKSIYK